MTPEEVPAGPLLLDTDVVTTLRLGSGRYGEFFALAAGHHLLLNFVVRAEIRAARHSQMPGGLAEELEGALSVFGRLEEGDTDCLESTYARLHARLRRGRRHNDLWIAASALPAVPALPVVTANLRDYEAIADEFGLVVVHPDRRIAGGGQRPG